MCGEVTTSNRFELINQEETRLESRYQEEFKTSEEKTSDILPVDSHYYEFNAGNTVLNESFHDFMGTKSKYMSNDNHYMYTNKNNFCSGYFPDFITLDNDICYNISEGNNYSHYYLYTKNKRYLKTLSNSMSKYNNRYFDDMNFAYIVSKKHSWVLETQRNTNLFRDSYFYKKHRLQTLRDTGIGIPEDLNKTYSSEESRIGNQRGSKGNEENEITKFTLRDSRRGVPIGTYTSEDSRRGIQRGSKFRNSYLYKKNNPQTPRNSGIRIPKDLNKPFNSENSRIGIQRGNKPTQCFNPTNYEKHNKDHLVNSQTHYFNSYHDSHHGYSCREGQYYHNYPQYSKNKCNNKNYSKNECSNQKYYGHYNYDHDGNQGRESGHYGQNSDKYKNSQRSKPDHPDQYLDKCKSDQTDQFHVNHHNHRKYYKTIQYSHPHHYDEANKIQNHSKQYKSHNPQKTEKENITPARDKIPRPRKKLYQNPEKDKTEIEMIPVDTDLEVLLVNSWKIDAPKIQTIVEDFIRDKKYTTIFCLTETKVEGHDFQPDGIKIFSKQRRRKMEKRGED